MIFSCCSIETIILRVQHKGIWNAINQSFNIHLLLALISPLLLSTYEKLPNNYQKVVFKLARVNAARVVDGAIPFHDTNAACTSAVQVAHAVKSNISKTLHNKHHTAIICTLITKWIINTKTTEMLSAYKLVAFRHQLLPFRERQLIYRQII